MSNLDLIERIELIYGDITKLEVEAVVNAANSTLLGGGGVDGAIHRAAGPELLKECRTVGGCPTGEARLTKGYNLPAKYVIHTAGPVWHGGNQREEQLLAECYRNSLQLASAKAVKKIAFPAISCGVYRFPLERAVKIAFSETLGFLKNNRYPEVVIFVSFGEKSYRYYQEEMQRLRLR